MPKANINGITIHYQTTGQGPDVVLIHGATANMAFWYMSSLPALVKEFRVTVYDLRGHGYSQAPPSGYTSADMSADLTALLDHLNIHQASLVGHSFGGVIALHTAVLSPERVTSLVLADPEIPALRHLCDVRKWRYWEAWNEKLREFGLTVPDDKWDDLDYVLRQSLYIPMAYGLRKGQPRKSKRLLQLLDHTTAVKDFRELSGLTMEKICGVSCPVLAIYGELSPFLPVCDYLKEHMTRCTSVIVPTGHFHPGLEPEEFVKHVKQFLHDPLGVTVMEYAEDGHAGSPPVKRSVLDNLISSAMEREEPQT